MKNSSYKLIALSFFFISTVLSVPMLANGQVREWVDKTGKFKIKAEFKGVEGNKVVLQRIPSGKRVTIPLDKLSDADQAFVTTLTKPKKVPEVVPEAVNNGSSSLAEPPAPEPKKAVEPKVEPKTEPMVEPKTEPRVEPVTEPITQPEPTKPEMAEPKIEPKKPEPQPVKAEPITPPVQPRKAPRKAVEPITFSAADLQIPVLGTIDPAQLASLPAPFGDLATEINESDDTSKVRRSLESLNDLPIQSANSSLINLLQKMTDSDDEFYRRHALKQLTRIQTSEALPFIARSISDRSNTIRRQSFEFIKTSNDPRFIPALVERFPSVDRDQIFSILEGFGSLAEIPIHPMLQHEKTKVRRETAELLIRIGTSASVSVLEAAKTDESGMVQLLAKKALKEIKKRGQ